MNPYRNDPPQKEWVGCNPLRQISQKPDMMGGYPNPVSRKYSSLTYHRPGSSGDYGPRAWWSSMTGEYYDSNSKPNPWNPVYPYPPHH